LNHWLKIGKTSGAKLPKIFFVNWFRRSAEGKFLWPGFGDNCRVLKWIFERVEGSGKSVESPIGRLPTTDAIDTSGLTISKETMQELLRVDADGWAQEVEGVKAHFAKLGERLPHELQDELASLEKRLANQHAVL
ncbi:MAG TPA: phosphoenolpyruvate carboxykinase domain-containing protein, partial [Kiritimatiellia bacterium]